MAQFPAILSTRARFTSHRWLILILALCAPGLFIDLDQRGPEQWMEGIALLSSRETAIRHHQGEENAWLVPTVRNAPRLRKPPLLVWLNLAAWSDLDPRHADAQQMIGRARAVTATLSLLLVFAIYWMARSLQDRTFGLIAAIVASTMLLLFNQGRLSTYDMHVTAWAALATAAALFAMRPFDEHSIEGGRRFAGIVSWIVAGIFLGAAILSKNPLCAALAIGPLAGVMVFDRRRIATRFGGLLLMCAVAIAVSAWWFILAHKLHPKLAAVVSQEIQLLTPEPRPATYYFSQLWWLAFPWTFWLIIGVIHPFTKSVGSHRARRMIIWIWFITILIALSLPAQKERRYLVFALPAMSLVIAQVLRDQLDKQEQLCTDGGTRIAVDIHWASIIFVGGCLTSLVMGHELWPRKNWLRGPMLDPWPPALALAVGFALLIIALWGWRAHRQGHVSRAMIAMALFGSIASFSYMKAYARTRDQMHIVRDAADTVRMEIGDSAIWSLRQRDRRPLSYEFLFYAGRITDVIGAKRALRDSRREQFYLCAEDVDNDFQMLRDAGFQQLFPFNDLPDGQKTLWRGPIPADR